MNISYISVAYISGWKLCYGVKPSACYFYVGPKVLVDFRICVGVPRALGRIRYANFINFFRMRALWAGGRGGVVGLDGGLGCRFSYAGFNDFPWLQPRAG